MSYKEITIFELVQRCDFLVQVKKDIIEYFNKLSYDLMEHPIENEDASILRQKINQNLRKIIRYISATGTPTSIYYSPPPSVGGLCGEIDFFENIFNLSRFRIPPATVVDSIDQSLGIYNDERFHALWRTINPLWWIWKLVKKIVRFPFFLIKEAGFNASKVENSFLGKFYSFVSSAIILLASALAILNAFGYQEKFVNYIKGLFGI